MRKAKDSDLIESPEAKYLQHNVLMKIAWRRAQQTENKRNMSVLRRGAMVGLAPLRPAQPRPAPPSPALCPLGPTHQ
jgi:hypothetical protein